MLGKWVDNGWDRGQETAKDSSNARICLEKLHSVVVINWERYDLSVKH